MPKYEQHKVWLNGEIVPPEEAKISVFSQAVLRGGSVYEGLRAYRGEERDNLFVWMLDSHIDRLFGSMKIMRIESPYTRDEMRGAVLDWIRANDFRDDMHCRLYMYLEDAGRFDMKVCRRRCSGLLAWLCRPKSVSTTIKVSRRSGTIECLRSDHGCAWRKGTWVWSSAPSRF